MKSSNRSLVIGIMGMALAMGGGSAPAESRPKAKVRPRFESPTYRRLTSDETPSSKYRKNANQRRDRRKKLAMANALVGSR